MKNSIIVSKFGGSSLATAESIRNVKQIIDSHPERMVIVVSAPGRRYKGDQKITDLLIQRKFDEVLTRFYQIAEELQCSNSLKHITDLEEVLRKQEDIEWIMSRGEYLMAQIFAEFINAEFVDAAELLHINGNKKIEQRSYAIIRTKLSQKKGRVVIPGFYGKGEEGVVTLPRNGSDISGAAIARGLDATLYEVWTDVNGVMTADPNKERDASYIPTLTIDALMEMNSQVFHYEAAEPLLMTSTQIHIKNTFNPTHPGTLITPVDIIKDTIIPVLAKSS